MKTIKFIILFIFIGLAGYAQQDLSLTDAISKALENNYDMVISRKDQRVAEINNNWGTAGRYPYINLSMGNDNSLTVREGDNTATNRVSAGASVSWTLFDGYSVRINKTRYEELENLSKQNTAIMAEGTIQSVILAYYNVLLQKEKLEVYREVMNLSEDRYSREKESQGFGTSVTYDVLQAQNSYLSDRSGYLLQEVTYKNALRDLNYLMAEKENTSYKLTEELKAIPIDYTLGELQGQLFENNKSLQNQYVNQRLLENAVASAKSNFYPSLSFSGGATSSNTRSKVGDAASSWANSANFYGNFTLSMNLFSGGTRKRAVQIAKIDEEIGLVAVDQIKLELSNSLANLFEYYEVRKELLNVASENLAAARLNLQISREKFEAGAINSFNFRDVQNLYLNAALQNLQAIYNFIDTHTSLLRMTGTIIQEYE